MRALSLIAALACAFGCRSEIGVQSTSGPQPLPATLPQDGQEETILDDSQNETTLDDDPKQTVLDKVPPTVTCPDDFVTNAPFALTCVADDAETVTWSSDSPAVIFETPSQLASRVSATSDGSYVLTVTATDKAGNAGTATVRMTWDTTGPVLSNLKTVQDDLSGGNALFDNDTDFFFVWDPATDSGAGIQSYTLKTYALGGCAGPSIDTPGLVTNSFAASGSNGGTMSFQLEVFDHLGNSSLSPCSSSMTIDLDPPPAMAAPTDHGLFDDAALTFNWLAASDIGPAGIASYELEIRTTPANALVFSGNVGMALTHHAIGAEGESYLARVRAVDAGGNLGPWSADSDGVTIDSIAPTQPAAPTDGGVYSTNTNLSFNWINPGDVGLAGVASYDLEVGTSPGANDVYSGNLVGLTHNIVGTNGSSYYARVRAIDSAGNISNFSTNSNGILVDTGNPTPATNLITPADSAAGGDSTYDDDTTIYFRWSAGSDAESGIAHYDVTIHNNGSCSSAVGNANGLTGTSTSFVGSTGVTYTFEVNTFDAAGRSSASGCSTPITILDAAPTVTAVSAPSQPVVSSAGIITQSVVNVTCSMDGHARIDDNADGDPLVDWTPVTASVAEPLTIFGTDLAGASSDGPVTLRVTCRNLAMVPSATNTSRSVVIDTTPPPGLSALVGATGSGADGTVSLTVTYPGLTADYNRVSVRRAPGATAPADCGSGTEALVINTPFVSGPVTDATGSGTGGFFSYRLCIYDIPGNLTDSLTEENIQARDTAAPPALSAFTVNTGAGNDGEIDLTWTYPATVDYAYMEIRELGPGGTAPNAGCTNGNVIQTVSSPFSQTSYTRQTGSSIGELFGYRACIYDSSGNLTSSNVASNVQALDTSDPIDLLAFNAAAGASHGAVQLTVTNPADVSDWDTFEIRMLAGGSAPANCSSGSVLYTDSAAPFGTGGNPWTTTHATGSNFGDQFSYRVCIYDTSANTTSSYTASASAEDLQVVPSTVTTFSGATGAGTGEINVTVTFAATTDYQTVTVRRIAGATAPNANCTSDGSVVRTYTSPTFTNGAFVDTGTAGTYYSYRLCIYDGSSNLASTQTITNVQAKPNCAGLSSAGYCWYFSGADQSCTTFCAARGGCNLSGTRDYVGSGGTLAQCYAIAAALGNRGTLGGDLAYAQAFGCIFFDYNDGLTLRDTGTATTCAGVFGMTGIGARRICACNN